MKISITIIAALLIIMGLMMRDTGTRYLLVQMEGKDQAGEDSGINWLKNDLASSALVDEGKK